MQADSPVQNIGFRKRRDEARRPFVGHIKIRLTRDRFATWSTRRQHTIRHEIYVGAVFAHRGYTFHTRTIRIGSGRINR